jgi:hypothetical protein
VSSSLFTWLVGGLFPEGHFPAYLATQVAVQIVPLGVCYILSARQTPQDSKNHQPQLALPWNSSPHSVAEVAFMWPYHSLISEPACTLGLLLPLLWPLSAQCTSHLPLGTSAVLEFRAEHLGFPLRSPPMTLVAACLTQCPLLFGIELGSANAEFHKGLEGGRPGAMSGCPWLFILRSLEPGYFPRLSLLLSGYFLWSQPPPLIPSDLMDGGPSLLLSPGFLHCSEWLSIPLHVSNWFFSR